MHAVRLVVLRIPILSKPEVRGMTGYTVYPTKAAPAKTDIQTTVADSCKLPLELRVKQGRGGEVRCKYSSIKLKC
jgi:hypothetical protein